MTLFRFAVPAALLTGALISACGGGGSSSDTSPAADPPPANGSYAGTYACVTTTNGTLSITAVLPGATGSFSSCSGSASGGLTIACTGSIASGGAFSITGTDNHGNTLTFTGQATSTLASGTYTIAPASIAGDFSCTH